MSRSMRVSLTPPELEALAMACGEITSGEMYGWSEQRADALTRAHAKITRALDAGDNPEVTGRARYLSGGKVVIVAQ